jgi:flagella basal body P-ring formation protein FlgA
VGKRQRQYPNRSIRDSVLGLAIVIGTLLAVGLIFACPLSATTSPVATISLFTEAEVTGTAIILGEIAEIDYHLPDENDEARQGLLDIHIGRAPLPGNSRQIAIGQIEVRLRQAGIHPSSVKLIPPPGGSVKVTTATQEVTKAMVTTVVLSRLQERAGADFYVSVEAGDALPLIVPLGQLDLRMEALPPGPGNYRANVGVHVDGQRYRTIQVRVQLESRQPVVVAARDIPAGAIILPEAVVQAIPDVSPPKEAFLESAAVIGLETQRTIKQGEPITSKDVSVPLLVQAGDIVVIEALSGAITVKTLGVALQNGKLGDVIQVENIESRKEIMARIVTQGVVRLELFGE